MSLIERSFREKIVLVGVTVPPEREEETERRTEAPAEPEGSKDVTRDPRAFTVLVRNELYRLVRAIARRDWDEAAKVCEASPEWTRGW